MNLLYLDESGTLLDPKQLFFVLAGVSIYERQGYWIGKELDKIAERFDPVDPSHVELHASPMVTGRGFWRRFPSQDRLQAIKDALIILANSMRTTSVFACVIRKSVIGLKNPVEVAFEQVASRFDYSLSRLRTPDGKSQRGIIIFDDSSYETVIQGLAAEFRSIGHSWGKIKNLAEVPLFLDSKTSRLIQLADLVAYSIFKNYAQKDSQFFEIFAHKVDSHDGQFHGLCEIIEANHLK